MFANRREADLPRTRQGKDSRGLDPVRDPGAAGLRGAAARGAWGCWSPLQRGLFGLRRARLEQKTLVQRTTQRLYEKMCGDAVMATVYSYIARTTSKYQL